MIENEVHPKGEVVSPGGVDNTQIEDNQVEVHTEGEVAQEEQVATVVEKTEEAPAISGNEINIRSLRKDKERLERENREKDLLLQELIRKNQPKEQVQQQAQVDTSVEEDFTIADDDFLEGKHYRSLENRLKKQEAALNKYRQQSESTTIETKLRSQYSDFDKVVTPENIEALRTSQPELAETIGSGTNLYSSAVSAYKIIKQLGIYVEDNYKTDRDLAQQNSLKPKPLQSVSPQKGASPLEQANAFGQGRVLTQDAKKQIYQKALALSKQSR